MATINAEELAEAVGKELNEYFDSISGEVKKAVQATAKECVAEIKQRSPKRQKGSKEYSKSWAATEIYNRRGTIKIVIHNKKHYRLTHLLENGHAKRNGGRVNGIPHIAPAEKNAELKLQQRVEVAIRK